MKRAFLSFVLSTAMATAGAASNYGVSGSYLAARQASFSGDFVAASKYYAEAIMHDPARPELLERAALANLALGNITRASNYADKLEAEGMRSQIGNMAQFGRLGAEENYAEILARIEDKRGPGLLADGLAKGWALLGEGDLSGALVAFDSVSEQRGMDSFSAYHKALALAMVADYESALAIMEGNGNTALLRTRRGVMAHAEVLSQLKRNEDALVLMETSFGSRDLDPALRAMRERLEAGDTLPFTHVTNARDGLAEIFHSLAAALARDADEDFLLLYARLATHLRPDHTDAVLQTADLLESLDQPDLAVQVYKQVKSDNPAFHAAELGRAGALRASGRDDAAIEVLERLTETHGDLAIVHSTLADTLRSIDRFEEAADAYDAALERVSEDDTRHWFLYYARGVSHERIDDWPAAEADFRKALELNPDQPQVLNYLGYSLVQKEIKLDEALGMIQRAVAGQPDSGYIVDSLGWVLYRLGRYEDAVEHMERAAALLPVDPVVNDHLGDVYWAVGREMEARFQWRRALSFLDYGEATEEVDPERLRRKIEVGLDQVLSEAGEPPLKVANDDN